MITSAEFITNTLQISLWIALSIKECKEKQALSEAVKNYSVSLLKATKCQPEDDAKTNK